jgi:hypothetical protein
VPFPLAKQAKSSSGDCSICALDDGVVFCVPNRHPYCPNCFDHTITCQVTGEGRVKFVADGCKTRCPSCPVEQSSPSAFVMHLCAHALKESTFNYYKDCIVQDAVIASEKAAEIRFEEYKQKNSANEQKQNPDDIAVAQHLQHILEKLISASCPKCQSYFPDFDACAAVQCTCGAWFCAWCLTSVEADGPINARTRCHSHVREECAFNPSRNVYPPSDPAIWKGVMEELARKRVKDYIKNSGGVWCMVYGGWWCRSSLVRSGVVYG